MISFTEEFAEFIKNHEHNCCGIYRCCVNEVYWKRFSSCFYAEIDVNGQMICKHEDVVEGWGGGAYCNECWFHEERKKSDPPLELKFLHKPPLK